MKFSVEIELGNASMNQPEHIAAALEHVAHEIESAFPGTRRHTISSSDAVRVGIRDENGNTVGTWAVTS